MKQSDADTGSTVVRICFEKSQDDKVIPVVWHLGGQIDPLTDYHIDAANLQRASDRARAELQKFADAGRQGLPEKRKRELLRALAEAGADLFEALLTGSDKEETKFADIARKWYEENVINAPGARIDFEFCTEPSMRPVRPLCPWGVVFSSMELEASDADKSDALHDRFWALRHRVTSYEGMHSSARPAPSAQSIISWRKVTFYAFIRGGVDIDMTVRERVDKELEDHLLSRRDLKFASRKTDLNTLYYVSRGDRDGDESTTSDRLRPEEMAVLGEESRTHVLAVIDGYSVMKDRQASEWYKSLHKHNWSVFLATEADIEARPLSFFGLKILDQLITVGEESGSPLLDVVDLLRRSDQIRPWGLLYGLYAEPSRISLLQRPPGHFHDRVREAISVLQEHWAARAQPRTQREAVED